MSSFNCNTREERLMVILTCDRMWCPEDEECLVTSPLEAPFSTKLDSTGKKSSVDCCSNGTATDVAKDDPITANYLRVYSQAQ